MTRSAWLVTFLTGLTLVGPPTVRAQDAPQTQQTALNLFFDCNAPGCYDPDFFRREIPVVNWVRDREASVLHVLVTSQTTGGGGRLYTLAFLGRDELAGQDQELTVATPGDATEDDLRTALAERLKIGLVRYLADSPAADQIRVSLGPLAAGGPGDAAGPRQVGGDVDDPWNNWVFRVGGNAFLNGESSYQSSRYSGNLSANRTTDAWKLSLTARYSRNRDEYDVEEDEPPVVSLVEDWRTNALLVRSLSPKWSVGVTSAMGRNSRLNEEFRWSVSPGVEYDFVPYSESSRRLFTLTALLNVRHWEYSDTTIYFLTEETRLAASLTGSVNQIQPWGRANVSLTWSQYTHDSALNQLSLNGFVSLRLFRGFSVNVNGYYARIRDQLYLPTQGATTEEILLRQRALETSYTYFTSFGFSYQFGSIFNNVVNPRFGNVGDEGGFFFF